MAIWTEPAISIPETGKPVCAGTTRSGDTNAANVVTGFTTSKGGNGSNPITRPKRMYYWHL